MRRGFKAEAERHAQALRSAISSPERRTIDLPALAAYLRVGVLGLDQVLDDGLDALRELHELQAGAFSAATVSPPGGRHVVVYNPITEKGEYLLPAAALVDGRVRSNIAHELAHLILRHELRQMQKLGGHYFLTCNPDQEAEANWLGGALLLPRRLLLDAARGDQTDLQIAAAHHVSVEMARFRMNATGAKMQVARSRRSTQGQGA